MIYYSSGILNDVQLNYTIIEKEFLAVAFALRNSVLIYLGLKSPFSLAILR